MDISKMIRDGMLTVEQLDADNTYVFRMGSADGQWWPSEEDLEKVRDLIKKLRKGKEPLDIMVYHRMIEIAEKPKPKPRLRMSAKQNRLNNIK